MWNSEYVVAYCTSIVWLRVGYTVAKKGFNRCFVVLLRSAGWTGDARDGRGRERLGDRPSVQHGLQHRLQQPGDWEWGRGSYYGALPHRRRRLRRSQHMPRSVSLTLLLRPLRIQMEVMMVQLRPKPPAPPAAARAMCPCPTASSEWTVTTPRSVSLALVRPLTAAGSAGEHDAYAPASPAVLLTPRAPDTR